MCPIPMIIFISVFSRSFILLSYIWTYNLSGMTFSSIVLLALAYSPFYCWEAFYYKSMQQNTPWCFFQFGAIMNKSTIKSLYRSFCSHVFSLLLDKYIVVELLIHTVHVSLILLETVSFPKLLYHLIHLPIIGKFQLFHNFDNIWCC